MIPFKTNVYFQQLLTTHLFCILCILSMPFHIRVVHKHSFVRFYINSINKNKKHILHKWIYWNHWINALLKRYHIILVQEKWMHKRINKCTSKKTLVGIIISFKPFLVSMIFDLLNQDRKWCQGNQPTKLESELLPDGKVNENRISRRQERSLTALIR